MVDTARAAMLRTARSSCDLATPGSPTCTYPCALLMTGSAWLMHPEPCCPLAEQQTWSGMPSMQCSTVSTTAGAMSHATPDKDQADCSSAATPTDTARHLAPGIPPGQFR